MDSRHGKVRVDVEGDRLSNLPDDLIHKILYFISTEKAIETSALSSRWRYIWTSMPCLSFLSKDYCLLTDFSKFVTHVLSSRNNQIDVFSVKLTFTEHVSEATVKRISDYAFSHNVQQLNITCLRGKKIKSHVPVFISQSLQNLTLRLCSYGDFIAMPPTWELPALTTLNLYRVRLYYDNTDKDASLFSNCANLKNLTLKKCEMKGLDVFNICHHGLSSLTLEDGCEYVNVVTPQLKNLTVRCWRHIHLISAPNLSSLCYKDLCHLMKLSADLVHLEKVDICISYPFGDEENPPNIVHLLQQIHRVKFLTLNSEIIKYLSSFVEQFSHQPSPFTNLKSLKIYPETVSPEDDTEDDTELEINMSSEVKNYLLDSSPGAVFTMVSREETRAVMNVVSAQNLMRDLEVILDRLGKNSVIYSPNMEKDTESMETHAETVHEQVEVENRRAPPKAKMKLNFGERMKHIKCYWKDLNKQLEIRHKNTLFIISRLQKIEEVLKKLPTSHRDKLQPQFSSLCSKADTIMDNMMDRMKIQCDKKPSRSSVYFPELATLSHYSS
ncbi:hypothetical protein SSX86_029535 [Deinandra increscens subsp. villosa]|uniref:F-box domain-containing protein n=1 Tax=Deinandra increscens subsp. villosa TaxID=3103831 RepID=A0AAP0GMG2_9ASTR